MMQCRGKSGGRGGEGGDAFEGLRLRLVGGARGGGRGARASALLFFRPFEAWPFEGGGGGEEEREGGCGVMEEKSCT